jgi:pyruvate dehydrogenase E1 component
LTGEGLQHDDGHSLVLASTVPNLKAYDPAFAYETAAIIKHGIARMYTGPAPEDIFFYITLYNENFQMPAAPDAVSPEELDQQIVRGIYRFSPASEGPTRKATILFSGSANQAAFEAQRLLAEQHDVGAELWSVTSYKALREEALGVERHNRLHPHEPAGTPYLASVLAGVEGPVVAVTDFMKSVPDQVARWIPGHFTPLGTDGFGRSDTRAALRRHFETDAAHVVVAVLDGLRATGEGKPEEVADAISLYHIDADAPDPLLI